MNLERFWEEHPALLYGLALLLADGCAFAPHWSFFFPCAVLGVPLFFSRTSPSYKKRLVLACVLFTVFFAYLSSRYLLPSIPQEGVKGVAIFRPQTLSTSSSYFGNSWRYGGEILQFFPDEPASTSSLGAHLPCQVMIPNREEKERPSANHTYYLYGTLKMKNFPYYEFKLAPESHWIIKEFNRNQAEIRLKAKQAVRRHLDKSIQPKQASQFLAGIATGEFDDRMLKTDFSRFGLQHLMAISGFHFTIVAGVIGCVLRLFLGPKATAGTLIGILTAYMLFLGCSPSIFRSWLMISVFLSGALFEKSSFSLNSLGIALIGCLLMDPMMSQNLGFHFSFLATASLLIFLPLVREAMENLLPKRSLGTAMKMNFLNQHGYVILSFFREALALTLAVNAVALPFTLYCFYKFPVMSIIYNFFYPFFVSISILLLIAGLMFHPFSSLVGDAIHSFNGTFTSFILSLTYNMPMSIDLYIRTKVITQPFLVIYLTFLFLLGIYANLRKEEGPMLE